MTEEQLRAISPANGDKYSPNLHKWLRKHRHHDMKVWRFSDSSIFYIGYMCDGMLHGVRLMEVLCSGTKAEVYCYLGFPQEMPDFWHRYQEQGRCAIDTEHNRRFIGDENRYVVDGDTRTCQWCGVVQVLRRWQEVVEREEWELVKGLEG